jgi:hypothetical protein
MPKPKPTRKASGRKKIGRRKLAAVVVLLVIAGAVAFTSYGLFYGAVVDFTFGGKSDVRQSYQLVAMSKLQPSTIDITHILIRNTGSSGITVIVTMHAVNAVVSAGYYGPYSDTANIQLYLPSGSGYQIATFYLTLSLQVPTFTLRATAGQVLDFSSITTLATSGLASIQPTTPTTLVYTLKPASSINYELAEQY